MTLSDGELMNIHKMVHPHMYHFLLPLLRCDDITWDKSKKCLLLLGQIFAKCDCKTSPVKKISVTRKFRRNGGVTSIDEIDCILKINKYRKIEACHDGVYYIRGSHEWEAPMPEKRFVSEAWRTANKHIIGTCFKTLMEVF